MSGNFNKCSFSIIIEINQLKINSKIKAQKTNKFPFKGLMLSYNIR